MLFWSVTSWGVLMFIMGFTTHYGTMLLLRVLLGIAEGPLFALAYAIVKQTYTDRQQARASTMFFGNTDWRFSRLPNYRSRFGQT